MATEIDSILIPTIEPTGTTASEISGTMATETILVRWLYISETAGTTSVKWLAQWRANYPAGRAKHFAALHFLALLFPTLHEVKRWQPYVSITTDDRL